MRISRFFKLRGHEDAMILIGISVLIFILILTLLSSFISSYDPRKSYLNIEGQLVPIKPLLPPMSSLTFNINGTAHTYFFIFGTDQQGRDVFSRIISGASFVLTVAILAMLFSLAIGTPIGLLSGYVGGIVDRVISLIMDSIYAFPGLILAIAIAALLGAGLLNMIIAIAVVYIPSYFRIVRGQVLSLKEQTFIEAAQAIGAPKKDIVFKFILPNVLPSILVVATLNIADAIIIEASLSFLGLGIPPDTPDWGIDISEGRRFFLSGAWWLGLFPGLMIILSVIGFSLLGEGLDEKFNPRLRTR
jgi:peptide/nickel transport system permease protein